MDQEELKELIKAWAWYGFLPLSEVERIQKRKGDSNKIVLEEYRKRRK